MNLIEKFVVLLIICILSSLVLMPTAKVFKRTKYKIMTIYSYHNGRLNWYLQDGDGPITGDSELEKYGVKLFNYGQTYSK